VLAGLILWIVSFFRRGQAYLELAPADGSRGRRYPVDKDVLTVGAVTEWQGDPIDIVAPDPEKLISRLHCAIHRKGRDYYVVDHSSNGTLLDGRMIPRRLLIPLKRGSRIQLGSDFTLKFGFERRKK
jgi:pSer/pThr/pTyr-binding forkhead associated (FHA) protein